MNQWWYAEKGIRKGPVPETELAVLYQAHHIDRNTVVWKMGMDEWMPLGHIDELEALRAKPREPKEPLKKAPQSRAVSATPGSRFCARLLDCTWETLVVFSMVAWGVGYLAEGLMVYLTHPFTNYLLLVLCLPLALCLDALIYRGLGNTPGKAVLRIKTVWRDGSALSFEDYLKRNFSLWCNALYFGIVPVNFISLLLQYRRLATGEQTSYDSPFHYRVRRLGHGARPRAS